MAQPESNEQKVVWLLCLLAAIHVFIFSAAFPLFNNVDEQAHFDLVVKFSHGEIPRRLEPVSAESAQYIVTFGTVEYLGDFHGKPVPPPPWTQPAEQTRQKLFADEGVWKKVVNWESTQQPLYYALAGAWWNLGQQLGFEGGLLLYWLRFLNIFFVTALVWIGYLAAQIIFPDRKFIRIGVPALLASMPQNVFYSIENDVLSPLCFGAVFVCLLKFFRTETPGVRLGAATGLALAATFFAKSSNLPLLTVATMAVLLKIVALAKSGKLRAAGPSLLALFFCVALPVAGWTAWRKITSGSFTGMEALARFMGMILKPFNAWWHHPIFTPQGFWIFTHDLTTTFWRGEISWHRRPLALATTDIFFVISTIIFVGAALFNLLTKSKSTIPLQRGMLWFSLACLIASVAFLGFISIIYEFHDVNPSPEHPYFSLGRLMLGALIPFALLYFYGFDCALSQIKNNWAKPLALAGMVLFMLISEIVISRPVFSSQYNWFHM